MTSVNAIFASLRATRIGVLIHKHRFLPGGAIMPLSRYFCPRACVCPRASIHLWARVIARGIYFCPRLVEVISLSARDDNVCARK